MTADFLIRRAEPRDLVGVAAIYNHEIRTGLAMWNSRERSAAELAEWLAARQGPGAIALAAVEGEAVLGFGAFAAFRPHEGYAATVEHSVYVAAAHQRRGVGRTLLAALEAAARAAERHVMVGAIDSGNAACLALHARAGYVETARMPDVGRKFGRWLTLVMVQKILD